MELALLDRWTVPQWARLAGVLREVSGVRAAELGNYSQINPVLHDHDAYGEGQGGCLSDGLVMNKKKSLHYFLIPSLFQLRHLWKSHHEFLGKLK